MIWPSAVMLESFGATDALVSPLDGGHVHRTFSVRADNGRPLLVQAVNPSVTGDAWELAERTVVVSDALQAHPDPMLTDRLALRTRSGDAAVRDADGIVWRAFDLIDRAVAADSVDEPPAPGTVAHLFGRFDRRAAQAEIPAFTGLPFHELSRRLDQWQAARAAPVADAPPALVRDLDELLNRVEVPTGLPSRVVHNDAKPANLLLDVDTGTPLSIIDLDLVDHGSIVDDVGDLVRSQAFPAEALDLDRLTEVLDGYLHGLEPLLDHDERRGVSRAAELITLELAVRRLTDHVSGAGYFADAADGENLAQAHRQMARVRQLLDARDEIDAIAWQLTDGYRAPSTG
jgi:Ser/Thr protein kinase RdoA (MazF antagonist)